MSTRLRSPHDRLPTSGLKVKPRLLISACTINRSNATCPCQPKVSGSKLPPTHIALTRMNCKDPSGLISCSNAMPNSHAINFGQVLLCRVAHLLCGNFPGRCTACEFA